MSSGSAFVVVVVVAVAGIVVGSVVVGSVVVGSVVVGRTGQALPLHTDIVSTTFWVDHVSWRFVDRAEVVPGPWLTLETASPVAP
ncbi:MAG: hypothetical protein H7311_10035 [Ramlibacter sp.]|nr:hypothetical protein [Cryobacterium sp.]